MLKKRKVIKASTASTPLQYLFYSINDIEARFDPDNSIMTPCLQDMQLFQSVLKKRIRKVKSKLEE